MPTNPGAERTALSLDVLGRLWQAMDVAADDTALALDTGNVAFRNILLTSLS